MTLKEMLLERQVNQSERLGCLMAMIDEDVAKKILDFNKKLIHDDDLYHEFDENGKDEYGREDECHVTVRYGFVEDLNELEVRQLLKGQKEFLIEVNGVDTFNTNPKYDVVKFNVSSPLLKRLNDLSGIYPNKSNFPDYHPHLTLAYVKKGKFPHKKNISIKIPVKSICYSPIRGSKSYFNLTESVSGIDSRIEKLEQEWERLDSTGTGGIKQKEIGQEIENLKNQKKIVQPNSFVDVNRAKELFAQMRHSLNEIKLTKDDAQEILHKLGVLDDTPDLQSDYGITQEQSHLLLNTIPYNGGEWNIPDWAIPAVKGEITDHVLVLRDIAQDARNGGEVGQALAINRQANRLESLINTV